MRGRKALNVLCNLEKFRNPTFISKRMIFDNQLLSKLWNNAHIRDSCLNSCTGQNDSISNKNTGKLLAANSIRKETNASVLLNGMNGLLSLKGMLLLNILRRKPDIRIHSHASINILKFCFQQTFLENFFLRYSKKLLSKTKQTISKEEIINQWGGPEAYNSVIFINNNEFKRIINENPYILIFFSANWCQHCLRLKRHFGTAALMAKEANLPMSFATFDVTSDPNVADENGVVGIPTVKFYKNGKIIATYKGKRTADDIFEFAKNPPSGPSEIKKADV